MIWSLLALLALQDAPPPPAPAQSQGTPEMAEAIANKPLVKTAPAILSQTFAGFPEEARAQGAHGKVTVEGIITREGKFIQAQVVTSSRSDLLDTLALAAAQSSTFAPAKDAAGNPIAVPVKLPLNFNNARSPGTGGGVLRYRCDQFVRDQDWWNAHWPATEHDETYTMALGVSVIGGGGMNIDTIQRSRRDLAVHWKEAIEACRTHPDAIFIDMLKPEGQAMRALAERTK